MEPARLSADRGVLLWHHPKGTLDVMISYGFTGEDFRCVQGKRSVSLSLPWKVKIIPMTSVNVYLIPNLTLHTPTQTSVHNYQAEDSFATLAGNLSLYEACNLSNRLGSLLCGSGANFYQSLGNSKEATFIFHIK